MARIEVRVVSVLLGALALAVVMILVFAPPGETQVEPEADVAFDKFAFSETAAIGDEVQFNLSVTNLGPNVASNVIVTDTLPATVEILFVEDNCAVSPGNIVTCEFGDLGPGIGDSVNIGVCPTAAGPLRIRQPLAATRLIPTP